MVGEGPWKAIRRTSAKSASGHFDVTDHQKSMLGAENRVDNNIFTIAVLATAFVMRRQA